MGAGKINNNTGYDLEYMLLKSKSKKGNFKTVRNSKFFTFNSTHNYLVLRLPAGKGFDFREFNKLIRYDPVQVRVDEQNRLILVFAFSFAPGGSLDHNKQTVQESEEPAPPPPSGTPESGSGDEEGSDGGGDMNPPEPPVPPS